MDSTNSAISITNTDSTLTTKSASSVEHHPSTSIQKSDTKESIKTETEIQPQELEEVVTQLNAQVQNINRSISFSVDQDSGKTVVRVFNSDTEELIRQMPGDETLKLAAAMQEGQANSLLFNTEA